MLRLDVVAGRAMLQLIPRHKRKIVDLQVRSVSLTFRRTLYSTFNNLVVLLEITVVDRTSHALEVGGKSSSISLNTQGYRTQQTAVGKRRTKRL